MWADQPCPGPATGLPYLPTHSLLLPCTRGARADKGGVVHAGLGKVSFTDAALAGNVASFMAAILAARPRGLKGGAGAYVRAATLSSTMGPGIPVSLASLTQAAAAAQVNA